MSFRKLNLIALMAITAISAASCKDDEETTALPQLSGLTFSCPSYVLPEQRIKMTPRGTVHPDNKGIGYYWKVTPSMSKSDTTRLENGLSPDGKESDGSFTFTFSDTLGTYTVNCYAFAEGHSGDAHSITVEVVKGGIDGSVTNTGISSDDPKFTEGGQTYYYTTVGGLDWLRRNISDESCGVPMENCNAASDVFGRYYSHEEAMTVCPEGWRLPTEEDWISLCKACGAGNAEVHATIPGMTTKLMANAYFNDMLMTEYWPEVGEIRNDSGLSLIPSGYANLGMKSSDGGYPDAVFEGLEQYSVVWTADVVEGDEGMAYYRYIINDQPDLMIGKGDRQSFGASVRCVRSTEN